MPFTLGFIGGGNMSTAIFEGIVKNGTHPPSKIWVSGPHVEKLKHWADKGATTTNKNSEVFANCDVIFLGVKPNMLKEAVRECLENIEEIEKGRDKLIISMLAGVEMAKVNHACSPLGSFANIKVIRIMPNTPMAVGHGICLYTLGSNTNEEDGNLLKNLLNNSCISEEVSESMMATLGILTACGPAMMYIVIEALADGAVKQGVPRELAQKFAAQTVIGSGHMVLKSGKHPGLLKDEVCSPGGTTICAVSTLENGNMRATFINAIEAATLKSQGKKN